MSTITIERELKELKTRQARLEKVVFAILRGETKEEVRPEYLRKLERIRDDMDKKRGVITIHNNRQLREFFRKMR